MSNTQIDRLGDRLRTGVPTEIDLRMLDEFRHSFGEAYERVVTAIREQLSLQPTGRPAKSTPSLVEKLQRESIRLVQVQDIAGCRVVAGDVGEQERIVSSLCRMFHEAAIVDRRATPSYGYRAVHVIVRISNKAVEIQVRTVLQHLWAELSEKLSDVVDPEIKYGGGPDVLKQLLGETSRRVAQVENMEVEVLGLTNNLSDFPEHRRGEVGQKLREVQQGLVGLRTKLREEFDKLIAAVERMPGRNG